MWEVIIGGLLASGSGALTQLLTYFITNRRIKRAMAGAFSGEISAICQLARNRRFIEAAKDLLSNVRNNKQASYPIIYASRNYLIVYENNASGLGLLPTEISKKIAIFYTQIKALLEDTAPGVRIGGEWTECEKFLIEHIKLSEDTLTLGEEISDKLDKKLKNLFWL